MFGDGTTLDLAGGLLIVASGNGTSVGTGMGDTMRGGSGTEILSDATSTTSNTFIAGIGTETLEGGGGSDIYEYAAGDGSIVINDNYSAASTGTSDTLKLDGSLSLVNVVFSVSGQDLIITDGVSGDRIDIGNQYLPYNGHHYNQIETLVFGDGTTLDLTGGLLIVASGNGTSVGTGMGDTMRGGTGTEILSDANSTASNTFIAGTGPETMLGGGGNNIYSYAAGDGSDTINDSAGTDTLVLGAGLTTANVSFGLSDSGAGLWVFAGAAGNAIDLQNEYSPSKTEILVFGDGSTMNLKTATLSVVGTGNGTFYGPRANSLFIGGTGTETLSAIFNGGWAGNDTFIAGIGQETLIGGGGSNVYSYASGDGSVTIQNSSGANTLVLNANLAPDNIALARSGNDLVMTDQTGGDRLDVVNHYGSSSNQIQTLDFSDGVVLNLTASLATGTSGNDTLSAASGNVIFMGGAGNDTETGGTGTNSFVAGTGNDTFMGGSGTNDYIVEPTNSMDVIQTTGGTNTLIFGGGIARDQLWFTQSGQDLDISVIGTNQQVVVQNWFAANTNQIQQIETAGSGSILANTQVANLVNAMASLTPPSAGQTTLTPDLASQIEPVIAANWH